MSCSISLLSDCVINSNSIPIPVDLLPSYSPIDSPLSSAVKIENSINFPNNQGTQNCLPSLDEFLGQGEFVVSSHIVHIAQAVVKRLDTLWNGRVFLCSCPHFWLIAVKYLGIEFYQEFPYFLKYVLNSLIAEWKIAFPDSQELATRTLISNFLTLQIRFVSSTVGTTGLRK